MIQTSAITEAARRRVPPAVFWQIVRNVIPYTYFEPKPPKIQVWL